MNLRAISKRAKETGVNALGKDKVGLIRDIQKAEHNLDCFATPRVKYCEETACLWRNDCMKRNGKEKES